MRTHPSEPMSLDLLSSTAATGPGRTRRPTGAAMTRCRRRRVRPGRGARASPPSATTRSTWWCAPSGVPIRVASKSVRVREVIDATLATAGLPRHPRVHAARGAVARRDARRRRARLPDRRPRRDRRARRRRARGRARDAHGRRPRAARPRRRRRGARHARRDPRRDRRRRVVARARRSATSACAARRCTSPARSRASRAAIAARPGFRLVGLMMYEAQIAGQGDATGSGDARHPLDAAALARTSCSSVAPRSSPRCATSPRSSSSTAAAPARSSCTASDQAVTELTAGSGLLAGHLFDGYRAFDPGAGGGVRARGRAQARCPTSRRCSAAAGSRPARRSRRASRCRCGRRG